MAKRRYSEIKHEDKFHEALSAFWTKVEPYLLHVGIAAGVVLVVAAIWIFVAQRRVASTEAPWAEHYKALVPQDAEEPPKPEKQLEALAEVASEYRGKPVAAITHLELAQRHFSRGMLQREMNPESAKAHFEKAASAAEQFVADFPDHRFLALAHFEAGKARLELQQYEQAADHFEHASQASVPYLAALAQWHAARCYERLGRLDRARRAYEALRDSPTASWVAQQADFQLSQLEQPTPRDH